MIRTWNQPDIRKFEKKKTHHIFVYIGYECAVLHDSFKYRVPKRCVHSIDTRKYAVTICQYRLLTSSLPTTNIYLELAIDSGEFSGLWFSYALWYVAFRKKWLQTFVRAIRSYVPLKYVTTSTIIYISMCI